MNPVLNDDTDPPRRANLGKARAQRLSGDWNYYRGWKEGVMQGRNAGPNCGRPMHLITVSALDVVGIVATGSTEGI